MLFTRGYQILKYFSYVCCDLKCNVMVMLSLEHHLKALTVLSLMRLWAVLYQLNKLLVTQPTAGELELDDLWVPFQPSHSMILWEEHPLFYSSVLQVAGQDNSTNLTVRGHRFAKKIMLPSSLWPH